DAEREAEQVGQRGDADEEQKVAAVQEKGSIEQLGERQRPQGVRHEISSRRPGWPTRGEEKMRGAEAAGSGEGLWGAAGLMKGRAVEAAAVSNARGHVNSEVDSPSIVGTKRMT